MNIPYYQKEMIEQTKKNEDEFFLKRCPLSIHEIRLIIEAYLNKKCFIVDQREIFEWISVEDKLPDVVDAYIVAGKQKYPQDKKWEYFVDVADYYPGENAYIDGMWNTFNDWKEGQETHITHWMPFPIHPLELEKMINESGVKNDESGVL